MMNTIIGLGNKGSEYEGTRHNAGRSAVVRFVEKCGGSLISSSKYAGLFWEGEVGGVSVRVLVPETFMNQSGGSAKKAVGGAKEAESLIVVYDDIDLPLGVVRVSFDRSAGGHNGLQSIIKSLGTEKFARIRIGVCPVVDGAPRKPKSGEGVLKLVMSPFKKTEEKAIDEAYLRAGEAMEHIVVKGVVSAMNHFH